MKRLILVDGNSLMYRAYFGMAAMGNLTQNSKGQYTNAIYAFARMMNTLINSKYDNILVAFDAGKKTFRHDIIAAYKDGRSAMPDEMKTQIAYIKEFLEIMRIKQYQLELYEADDIIGTLCKEGIEAGYQVDIYSSDKDLLQLVSDNSTVYLTKKGMTDLEAYTPKTFFERYGITTEQFIDLKAMMGDKSDNLAGIPGIGEKKAVKYLQQYQTLENLIEHKDEIKGADGEKIRANYEMAITCKKMVSILRDAPIKVHLDETVKTEPDVLRLKEFYEFMEFNSLLKDFSVKNKTAQLDDTQYKVISDPYELKSILVPYSSLLFETYEYNYHKASLTTMAIKNHLGSFIINPDLIFQSIDLQLFLSDKENHKSVYDYKRSLVLLKKIGIDLDGVDFDMLLATYILNPSIAKEEMKVVANYYQYNDVFYEEEIYGKGAKKAVPDNETLYKHVIKKVNAIFILRKSIIKALEEKHQLSLLLDIEIPLSRVLAKMEFNGMMVDKVELGIQKQELKGKLDFIEAEIYRLCGEKFNIASPKQLGIVLFEHLAIEYPKKTKSGYSTDIDILSSIRHKHEVVDYIILYRQLSKLYSGYVEGLEALIYEDGKVHTIFQQALTQTGRLSSVEPNLQNIPIKTEEGHKIRKMFVPTNPKNTFFSADYSQVELRVLASMANVEKLIDSFKNGEDIHTKTAMQIFEKDHITDLDRRRAKAVNFGIIYGISAFGLSSDINISVTEANNFIKKYMQVYPEIQEYMDQTVEFAKEFGYVKTLKNRIRYIPDINSNLYQQREFAKRTAMNAPIQGSAADIIKIAMIKIDDEMEKHKLKSKMLIQVHDELVFEIEENEKEIMQELVVRCMENAVTLQVPLSVDYSFGSNWYEVK